MNNNTPDRRELIILENIYDSSEQDTQLRQRDLAQIAGTSLGMTNSILKQMAKKGWITVKKLNSRNIHYAITLDGINEMAHRSYGYFKRIIQNVVLYKDNIDAAIFAAKERNVGVVILVGPSDLEFILEHSCQHYGLSFLKITDISVMKSLGDNTLEVYSENIPINEVPSKKTALCLSRMVLEITAEFPAQSEKM
jgi:DNA-binding MarR family transcriptional regulator